MMTQTYVKHADLYKFAYETAYLFFIFFLQFHTLKYVYKIISNYTSELIKYNS